MCRWLANRPKGRMASPSLSLIFLAFFSRAARARQDWGVMCKVRSPALVAELIEGVPIIASDALAEAIYLCKLDRQSIELSTMPVPTREANTGESAFDGLQYLLRGNLSVPGSIKALVAAATSEKLERPGIAQVIHASFASRSARFTARHLQIFGYADHALY